MLPDMVPPSLMTLLAWFAPLFTAPSFRTFTGLACGFLAQGGKRTVCGMPPRPASASAHRRGVPSAAAGTPARSWPGSPER
jgi:hypothetical protein